jgi:hypothetical protein
MHNEKSIMGHFFPKVLINMPERLAIKDPDSFHGNSNLNLFTFCGSKTC